MREALQIVGEKGLQPIWEQHERLYHKLWEGLNNLGLYPFVEDEKDRLVTVNTIKVGRSFPCCQTTGFKCHLERGIGEREGMFLCSGFLTVLSLDHVSFSGQLGLCL